MKHQSAFRTAVGVAVAGLLLLGQAGSARAQGSGERALPEFRVTAPDGQEVRSTALTTESKWLLLYVSPDSPSSRHLVTALKEWQSPQLTARTVLLVRGTAAEAQAWVQKTLPQELAGIRWVADSRLEGWNALALHGTPVLLGIETGRIAWRLAGVLNKPGALESVVRTWVEAAR